MTLQPSDWVTEHAKHIPKRGHVLDLACGRGRHTRYLMTHDFQVSCVDINVTNVSDLESNAGCRIVQADLEGGNTWPFTELFDGIVVTNYLYRPLLNVLAESLASGGVLIYETFMLGNEQYGKPRNPDFLLRKDELKDVYGELLSIISFKQGYVAAPAPAMMQQICAHK